MSLMGYRNIPWGSSSLEKAVSAILCLLVLVSRTSAKLYSNSRVRKLIKAA
jgi:hypothetical protein